MKKKSFLVLILASAVITFLAAGTYAWFTANVTNVGNRISTGVLELNNGNLSEQGTLFSVENFQPGASPHIITPFVIKNTGTLDMKIKATVNNEYKKGENDWAGDVEDGTKKYFMIKPYVKINDVNINDPQNNQPMSFDEFKSFLEKVVNNTELKAPKTADGTNQEQGGICEIGGEVWLDSKADNCYQGVTAIINISIDAAQKEGQYGNI